MAINTSKKNWLKRMGWGAFFFFLIKGLLWIAFALGVGTWISSC